MADVMKIALWICSSLAKSLSVKQDWAFILIREQFFQEDYTQLDGFKLLVIDYWGFSRNTQIIYSLGCFVLVCNF